MPTANALRSAAILAALLVASKAQAAPTPPNGQWQTEDRRGVIEVAPCGRTLCGTIVGISDFPADGSVLRDIAGTPQCHLRLLSALTRDDDDRWHGTVRNPEDGRVYRAVVWIGTDGTLRLRGYIGLPLFGSTQLWQPFHGTIQPDCHYRKQ